MSRQNKPKNRGLRDALIADWAREMATWRIPDHVYPYEEILNAGGPVVVCSGRLWRALYRAGLPCDRFGRGGPDDDKPWLLDADDSLTEILDEHIADLEQREWDELLVGLGTTRREAAAAGVDYDTQAEVDRYAAVTAAIRAAMG